MLFLLSDLLTVLLAAEEELLNDIVLIMTALGLSATCLLSQSNREDWNTLYCIHKFTKHLVTPGLRYFRGFHHQNLLTLPRKLLTLIPSESPTLPANLGSRFTNSKGIEIPLLI